FSLGGTFPGPGALSQTSPRTFSSLPAGYGQHLSESQLQSIAQNTYKGLPVTQTTFTDPYASLRLATQSSNAQYSKPLFSQDVSLSSSIEQQKWSLPTFLSQNPNMIMNSNSVEMPSEFQSLSGQAMLNPPPAHIPKTSTLSQRLHFSGPDMFVRTSKSPPVQLQYDHRQSGTAVSLQALSYHYQQPVYQHKETLLDNSLNYEAVSPATTPDLQLQASQHQHQQPGETYMSLQDLASISSTQQKLDVNHSPQQQGIQKRPSPIVPDRQNKMHHKMQKQSMSQQEMFNGSGMHHSPQQSPVNIGSPHLQMSSPSVSIPNSSISQAPPPTVQAPADSTTKPKKPRPRKKKEPPPNESKSDGNDQMFGQQAMLSSPELSQRGNGNDCIANQTYLHNRAQLPQQHQSYSTGTLNNTAQNSPLLTGPLGQPYKAQQQHVLNYAKNVPSSPHMGNSNLIRQQTQTSPLLSDYQDTQGSSQSHTLSDALKMSHEAVYPGQGLMFESINPYESFSNQLGIESMKHEMYNSEESQFTQYGQYVSPNNVLDMQNVSLQSSTIDQDAFSNLMSDHFEREALQQKRQSEDKQSYYPLDVAQDDEFSHLAEPVVEKKDCKSHNPVQGYGSANTSQPAPPPPAAPKPMVGNPGSSFMESFLSFIQGKKPETLSSMSSAIIQNKPQLPKYIPEPPRPKRVEPPQLPLPSAKSTKNCDNKSKDSSVTFSDSDDTDESQSSKAVQKAISSLNNDNVKISTNKTGGLTMKINLNSVKKAEENAKKARQKRPKKPAKEKKFGLTEDIRQGNNEEASITDVLPARELAHRKAKEVKAKYVIDDDSDSDTLKPIRKPGEESDSEAYDSDRDPVWTPSAGDKKPSAFENIEFDAKRKRSKGRVKSHSSKRARVGEGMQTAAVHDVVELDSGSEEEQLEGVPPITEDLKVGEFVMEKKDLTNTESFPIWKIENGRMLHKFELVTENSRILHRSIPTFSSWLPSMRNGFRHIKVRHISLSGDKECVEVLEDYRPKPNIDSQKKDKYEEHPLVGPFNVYLQIFLSQALEPGFLRAITNEQFYLDALQKIDSAVTERLNDMDSKVRWKERFKDAIRSRPHIRELDRPNLKQSCQACEFASQPAIKSVHLFGNPYDRFTLADLQPDGPNTPMEFMIGKTAAKFVMPYHNLYHYKYNLFKRCQAKVKILQDSHTGDNAVILDQCLQNRIWVLQLFGDLKQLLENG
ncbi:hypothetical protein DPMN_008150, partial [Dreissena polymorpha]